MNTHHLVWLLPALILAVTAAIFFHAIGRKKRRPRLLRPDWNLRFHGTVPAGGILTITRTPSLTIKCDRIIVHPNRDARFLITSLRIGDYEELSGEIPAEMFYPNIIPVRLALSTMKENQPVHLQVRNLDPDKEQSFLADLVGCGYLEPLHEQRNTNEIRRA